MPDTHSIVRQLVNDLCQIFPGEYIHLGGDEMPPDSWIKSPEVNKLKEKYNLSSNHDV